MEIGQILVLIMTCILIILCLAVGLYKSKDEAVSSVVISMGVISLFLMSLLILTTLEYNKKKEGCPELVKVENVYQIK